MKALGIVPHALRWLLTVALLYGAYTETGPWTTGFLLFVALTVESHSYAIRRYTDKVASALGRLSVR